MQKYDYAKAKSTVAEAVAKMQKSSGYWSPDVSKVKYAQNKLIDKLKNDSKLASAMAYAAAAAKARYMNLGPTRHIPMRGRVSRDDRGPCCRKLSGKN